MKMIDHAMSWVKIVKIPTYDLNKVTGGNDECIYISYLRFIQLFKNKWIIRYLPRKAVFYNRSDFKQDLIPLLKDFNIKPVFKKPKTHKLTLWWSGCIK